jgi:hypothetical protein
METSVVRARQYTLRNHCCAYLQLLAPARGKDEGDKQRASQRGTGDVTIISRSFGGPTFLESALELRAAPLHYSTLAKATEVRNSLGSVPGEQVLVKRPA